MTVTETQYSRIRILIGGISKQEEKTSIQPFLQL